MKAKGIGAIILALVVVFGAIFGILVLGSVASAGKTNQGLYSNSNYSIAHEISSAWGYNTSDHTWYSLTFTVDKATHSVALVTPLHEQMNSILILTDNSSQDVYNLLQNGNLFTYSNIAITTTGPKANLSDAFMYFGTPVNASSTTSQGDKGISDYLLNQTLYSSSVNELGHNLQLSGIPYFASLFTSMPAYLIQLNQSLYSTSKTCNSLTITFTQYFEYAQHFALVDDVGLILLAFVFATIFIIYAISPEHYGPEEERARAFQTRRELPYTIVGVGILVIILAIIGFMGTFTPLGGWGGAIAMLFGFGLFVTVYTSEPTRLKYSTAMLWGITGAATLFVLNLFVPFGPITYNLATSPSLIASIAGWLDVLAMLGLAYIGLINTKRHKLRERYGRARPVR